MVFYIKLNLKVNVQCLNMNEKDVSFTVEQASKFLGVSDKTLRRWDGSKILIPFRDPTNNYRYYKKSQLENFARTRNPKTDILIKPGSRSSIMGVTEKDLNDFMEDKVNIKSDKLSEYRQQVTTLVQNLEHKLEEDEEFELKQMKHFGSCEKKTAISHPVSDLDVAVYLTPDKETQKIDDLLPYVRDLLAEAMKQYGMSSDQFSLGNHCVRITYKGSNADVDVVPVIPIKGRELLVDRSTGKWLETDISAHLNFIKRRRKSFDKFVHFVRLTKWWKQQHDVPLKSFAIELIWSHIIENEEVPSTFRDGFPYFFCYIVKTQLQQQIAFNDNYPATELPSDDKSLVRIYDPVNPKNNVTQGISSDEYSKILTKSQEAMNVLMMATCSPSKNKAIELWQRILGTSFNPYS